MNVFADYARYYNLLYRDKDYGAEAGFVLEVMRAHGCHPRTLLDLGCGTGRHAVEMARSGVQVTGVDMSGTMLDMGRRHLASLKPEDFPVLLPELYQGDARTVRLGRKFDAVTSLFHVMSYQNTEEDALSVMETAHNHLKSDGLFLFDFWYGPGVLRDLPERRERILEDDEARIRRVAEPEHRPSDNVVVVNYTVSIHDLENDQTTVLQEAHSMRYWFFPELRYLARQADFSILAEGAWLSDGAPSIATWNSWALLKKGT